MIASTCSWTVSSSWAGLSLEIFCLGSNFAYVCVCYFSEPIFKNWELYPPHFWLLLKKQKQRNTWRSVNMGPLRAGVVGVLYETHMPNFPHSLALPIFFPLLRPTPNCLVCWTSQCYFSYAHWFQLWAGPHGHWVFHPCWGPRVL